MPDFTTYPFETYSLDVSRETREKFNTYARLLLKWQKAINLVSETTLEDLEMRHFLDSAQLIKYIPNKNIRLADMGSGAGFPGMVLAIMGVRDVHLIESDVRKATFLREVSRETKTPVIVHDDRVEDVSIPEIDIITARALAPLKDLLVMADKLSTENHPVTCIFMKGERLNEEIEKAGKKYKIFPEIFQSVTDPSGKIVKINSFT